MASMEHPNIVTFLGVAWDSWYDLCLVSKFIAQGDLRGLLLHYPATSYAQGFDLDKLRMVQEIADGLAYVHSMEPKIVHRALKSKNLLLTERFQVKISDFGVSCSVKDQRQMTVGVGTSYWMAPAVMTGKQYNEKADIFSFGLVLSELDTHVYPYGHDKVDPRFGATGAQGAGVASTLTDQALLQLVAKGATRTRFSKAVRQNAVILAQECLATDPNKRPSAPELSYRLDTIMNEMVEPQANGGKPRRSPCLLFGGFRGLQVAKIPVAPTIIERMSPSTALSPVKPATKKSRSNQSLAKRPM